jgi:uncharacterized protein YecE (DUF72 family)
MHFDRDHFAARVQSLASQNVLLGTSSWKYPGWCGMIYEEQRYLWRGGFSKRKFEAACLREYARVFNTVCVDAAYYKFPDARYLESMMSEVPDEFLFAFKVTDEITIKRYTSLPRFGPRAGQVNPNYLNADLFSSSFIAACEPFRSKIGLLIFEFSRFYPTDYGRGRDFAAELDSFLSQIPTGWPYGVEIRNRYFLKPGYFGVLQGHGVTHVYNSWAEMPEVAEQMRIPGSVTNPGRMAARFLLKPGRKYQQAVDLFSPYSEVREPHPPAREAGATLIKEGASDPGRRTFVYVNNRLEGNALQTLASMIELAEANG